MKTTLQDVSVYTGVSMRSLRRLAKRIGEETVIRIFGPP